MILSLFEKSEKIDLIYQLILMFFVAIIDAVGVASIMPFISSISDPKVILSNEWLKSIYFEFNFKSVLSFQIFLGIFFFAFFVFSICFKAFASYQQLKFTSIREFFISVKIMERFFAQPYVWFLNRHTSELGNSILSEVNQVVSTAILPLLNFISQLLISLFLFGLILLVNWKLAVIISIVLCCSYYFIFYILKKYVSVLGNLRVKTNSNRFAIVNESFSGIKELKIFGYEKTYLSLFSKYAKKYALANSKIQAIVQLPRFAIEGLAFGGLILVFLFLLNLKSDFRAAFPIVVLFSMAGYRLLPALQQVYANLILLRSSDACLNLIYNHLNLPQNIIDNKFVSNNIIFNDCIKLENVTFSYPNSKRLIINNISINIKALTTVGIIGESGSGKTTILDLILGLLKPNSGILSIDNSVINDFNLEGYQKNIGYVPQQIYLTDNTIASNIAFGVNFKEIDYDQVIKVSKIVNLHDFIVSRLPDAYDTKVGERGVRFSGGQRQRIAIARALYHNPSILILDEATSALDNISEKILMEAINILSGKLTVIIVAHRLSTIKKCDKIYVIESGKVVAEGSYEYLLNTNYNFNKYVLKD